MSRLSRSSLNTDFENLKEDKSTPENSTSSFGTDTSPIGFEDTAGRLQNKGKRKNLAQIFNEGFQKSEMSKLQIDAKQVYKKLI